MTCLHVAAVEKKSPVRYRGIIVGRLLTEVDWKNPLVTVALRLLPLLDSVVPTLPLPSPRAPRPTHVGELANMNVKRVHEDVQVLTELGLVEHNDAGGVWCPCADVHIDMHVRHKNVAA